MNSWPMQVDHRDRRPVAASTTASPRPGRAGGEVRRADARARPSRGRARSRGAATTWLPSVITSAPGREQALGELGVIPAPSATFSPLTMQKSTSSSSRRRGQALLDRAPPGGAEHVGDEEDPHGRVEQRRRGGPRRDVVARVVRVRARAPGARPRRSRSPSRLRVDAADRRADVERRVGAEVRERDDERRRAVGWMSMRAPYVLPVQDVRRDADDRAVDRRVDVGPGRRADVERRPWRGRCRRRSA